MATGNWIVKPAHVRKTVGVLMAAGLEIQRVEVGRDGRIIVSTGKQAARAVDGESDLDRELEEFEAKHGAG